MTNIPSNSSLPKNSNLPDADAKDTLIDHNTSKVSGRTTSAIRKPRRRTKSELAGKRRLYRKLDGDAGIIRLDDRVWAWGANSAKKLLRVLGLSPSRRKGGSISNVSMIAEERAVVLAMVDRLIDGLNVQADRPTRERPVETKSVSATEASRETFRPVTSTSLDVVAAEPATNPDTGGIDDATERLRTVDSVVEVLRPDTKMRAPMAVDTGSNQREFAF